MHEKKLINEDPLVKEEKIYQLNWYYCGPHYG